MRLDLSWSNQSVRQRVAMVCMDRQQISLSSWVVLLSIYARVSVISRSGEEFDPQLIKGDASGTMGGRKCIQTRSTYSIFLLEISVTRRQYCDGMLSLELNATSRTLMQTHIRRIFTTTRRSSYMSFEFTMLTVMKGRSKKLNCVCFLKANKF